MLCNCIEYLLLISAKVAEITTHQHRNYDRRNDGRLIFVVHFRHPFTSYKTILHTYSYIHKRNAFVLPQARVARIVSKQQVGNNGSARMHASMLTHTPASMLARRPCAPCVAVTGGTYCSVYRRWRVLWTLASILRGFRYNHGNKALFFCFV